MLEVPFDRPRREEVKSDPRFVALRQEIWQSLKHGVRI
jgi:hypothetical protein